MEQGDVIELLDTLYSMISEAWGVPLGNDKCIIEREKALDLINEIKASMPSALAEAKRLVAARDEFIGNAKKEAESLRKSSEEKARSMIEEQEIIRMRFIDGLTQVEIAKKLGISQVQVSRLLRRTLKKVQEKIDPEGLMR